MKKVLLAVMVSSLFATCAVAAEKKPIEEIDADALAGDTQITPKGTGDDHMAMVWWIPNEFWESIFSRDATISEADKEAMLRAMSGVSLLAVVQADISGLGAFQFYGKDEIKENLKIAYRNADGQKQKLSPLDDIGPDLQVVLGMFKPILGAAMGNMGSNLHFYVITDKSPTAARLADPYRQGQIDVRLTRRDGALLDARIETPINALFVPRKCPNGKEAHISWKYCPWTGKQLAN